MLTATLDSAFLTDGSAVQPVVKGQDLPVTCGFEFALCYLSVLSR